MFCQQCRVPLTLDSSLDNLGPAAFNLLSETAAKRKPAEKSPSRPLYTEQQKSLYDQVSTASTSPSYRRSIPPSRHGLNDQTNRETANPAMSYIMLNDSVLNHPTITTTISSSPSRGKRSSTSTNDSANLLSHKVQTTSRLFSILSSHSDIDHPICTECTALLTAQLEKRLAFATKERDAYTVFLRDAAADIPTEAEREAAVSELESLKEQEAAALAELESLEAEEAGLEDEMSALEAEAKKLDVEEAAFWRERNRFDQELNEYKEERDSLAMRLQHDTAQLERLQRTNVFNDAFNISHDGFFGTINGLRLGRVSGGGKGSVTVEWAEVNAALGLTCLLLQVVAERLDVKFAGWRLRPCGSTSEIQKVEVTEGSARGSATSTTVQTYPLCYTSELPISLAFLARNFDAGMVAFLDCVRQLGKHVERVTAEEGNLAALRAATIKDHTRAKAVGQTESASSASPSTSSGLRLPYTINKDMINDVSIKYGTNSDEKWTRACKCMLTCCKMLLAHASNVGIQEGEGGK